MLFNFGRKKTNLEFSDDELVGSFIPQKPLKLGYNLKVQDGRICYLCYRDTVYYSFPAGNYVLNYDTVPKLLQRQEKKLFASKNKKVSKFTADMYFVKAKDSGRLEFNYSWKKFVFEDKTKAKFDVSLVVYYELADNRKFLDALLDEVAIIEHGQAKRLLSIWLKEDCKEYLYLNPLSTSVAVFENKYVAELVKYLNKEYNAIGINITSMELNLGGKRAFEPKQVVLPSIDEIQAQNPGLRAENLPRVVDNQIDIPQGSTAVVEETKDTTLYTNQHYCKKCQTEVVNGAMYCHKCGTKI